MKKSSLVVFITAWIVAGVLGTAIAEGVEPSATNQPIRPIIQRLEGTVGLVMPDETNALVNLYVRGLSNGQFAFDGWDTELTKELSPRDLVRIYLSNALQNVGYPEPTDSMETFENIQAILKNAYRFPKFDPQTIGTVYVPSNVNFGFTNIEAFDHPGTIVLRYDPIRTIDLSDRGIDTGPIEGLPHQLLFGLGALHEVVVYAQPLNDDELEGYLTSVERQLGEPSLVTFDSGDFFRAFDNSMSCQRTNHEVQGNLAVQSLWDCSYRVDISTLSEQPPPDSPAAESVETDVSSGVANVTRGPAARLIERWYESDGSCRGGSPDDPSTQKACEVRSEIAETLDSISWCYGSRYDSDRSSYQWHQCDPNSIRP